MPELVNDKSDFTIGIMEGDQYFPVIMWNLKIRSYISEKSNQYRAYGCDVILQGIGGKKRYLKFG